MIKPLKVVAGIAIWAYWLLTLLMAAPANGQVPIVGSTGSFSTGIQVGGSSFITSAPTNYLSFGWNFSAGGGEGDFLTVSSGSTRGFAWYSSATAGSPGSPIMALTGAGALSTTTSITGPIVVASTSFSSPSITSTGTFTSPSITSTGTFTSPSVKVSSNTALSSPTLNTLGLGWNYSGAAGESDFFDTSAAAGGFNWYYATTATAPGSPIMSLVGNTGALSVPGGFVGPLTGAVTGNVTGNLSGNATTATALAANPSDCATTTPAIGILANGTATCGSFPSSNSASGYVTLPGGFILQWGTIADFDTGPVTVTFPVAYTTNAYSVQIINTDATRIWQASGLTTTSFQAHNNGSGGGSWLAIGK